MPSRSWRRRRVLTILIMNQTSILIVIVSFSVLYAFWLDLVVTMDIAFRSNTVHRVHLRCWWYNNVAVSYCWCLSIEKSLAKQLLNYMCAMHDHLTLGKTPNTCYSLFNEYLAFKNLSAINSENICSKCG